MNVIETTGAALNWKVTTVKRAGLSRDLPSGNPDLMWVANSSTLFYGERDAVLVDTFLTAGQSKTLLDWVASCERNLTTIYVTHGHGDHFFGLAPLLDRFPQAKAVAVPEVVDEMKARSSRRPRSTVSGASAFRARSQSAWSRLRPSKASSRSRDTSSSSSTWDEPIRRAQPPFMSRLSI
ncbi:glyoxylase-like metal-dependent hydrolase (beta-lactamase superfamily II) [Bradyrhizobium diazoefficiens]